MGLDGEKMLARLTTLSQVDKMKQVKPLSYALFPGYHCPLMGAMLTIKEIKDAVMLVLGPDECSFYTKLATSGNGAMAANGCEIVSVVIDQHDVTFGCQQKLEEAFCELAQEYQPKAVFIVTTCVLEITGDDVESIADGLMEQYDVPIMVVHAENFKTDDHLPGIAHTLETCIQMMEPQVQQNCVNVLGLRLGDIRKTEVYAMLQSQNVALGLVLPGKSSTEEICQAAKAKVNLVVHPVGLELAKQMKEKFGIPYVCFERYTSPDVIYQAYVELFACLELPLPQEIVRKYQMAREQTRQAAKLLQNGSYFSGNTALCNYELHSFLTGELGMKPLLLQVSDLDADSETWRNTILQSCDPYVTRAANLGAMQYLYPLLKPHYNLGAGNAVEMQQSGTVMVRMPQAYHTLGFEVTDMVIQAFLTAQKRREKVGA